MRRSRFAPLALVLAAAVPDAAHAAPATDCPRAWAAACHHYVNRARFKPRTGRVEAVTVLADACPPALEAAATEGPRGEAARRFLTRLAQAQALLAAMNSDRFAAASVETLPGGAVRDLARSRRLVSASGEYLILRAEGVFDALGAWAGDEGGFDLRAALP